MSGCDAFRARLERELGGPVGQAAAEEMRALAWHEHLLGCAACRELLEAEQALEELLASLPTPQLSPRVARRVLARLRELRAAEESQLDALLALDSAAPPRDLARSVLAGLRDERARGAGAGASAERALDRLLDRDEVAAPAGLAARVLAGLAAERAPRRSVPIVPTARSASSPRGFAARRLPGWVLPIAAGLLVGLGGWALWPRGEEADPGPALQVASAEPEPELLAALDVLEEWDLLMDMEEDLDLLFSTLEPADELLLDFQDGDGSGAPERAPERAPDTPPALPPGKEPSSGAARDPRG